MIIMTDKKAAELRQALIRAKRGPILRSWGPDFPGVILPGETQGSTAKKFDEFYGNQIRIWLDSWIVPAMEDAIDSPRLILLPRRKRQHDARPQASMRLDHPARLLFYRVSIASPL